MKTASTGDKPVLKTSDEATDLAMFIMRQTPMMGNGLFATRDIKKGTRLFAELPIISTPPEPKDENIPSDFCVALYKLPPDMVAELDSLVHNPASVNDSVANRVRAWHHVYRSGKYRDVEDAARLALDRLAIFLTNCVEMGAGGKYGLGLFATYSRINHSCVPNVYNCYNPTIKRLTVHATRDIAADEQVFTSYVPVACRDHEQRNLDLEAWGFVCSCEACVNSKATDPLRQRISQLDQELSTYLWKGRNNITALMTPENAIKVAEELASLLRQQGLEGMDLCRTYHDCAELCLGTGDVEKALGFAHKELEVERCIIGTETEHMKENLEGAVYLIQHLETLEGRIASSCSR